MKPKALLLTPGAGADRTHHTLVALEQALAPLPVERVDFPYRKAGRKAPDRAPVLHRMRARRGGSARPANRRHADAIALGGRSMGGRMCSMAVAEGLPAAALVLISLSAAPAGQARPAAHRAPPGDRRAVPVRPRHERPVRHARRADRRHRARQGQGDPRVDRRRTSRPARRRRQDLRARHGVAGSPAVSADCVPGHGGVLRVELLELAVRRLRVPRTRRSPRRRAHRCASSAHHRARG